MGVKLFAWLGGLALFLGVVFMVKYSFENNLITPLGRIVIGGRWAWRGCDGLVAGARALSGDRAKSLRHRHRHPLRRSFCGAFLLRTDFPNDRFFRDVGGNALPFSSRSVSTLR